MKMSSIERFMSRVFKHSNGCWIWIASNSGGGDYGSFRDGGEIYLAHRWIRNYTHNDIDDKLCLHKCNNKSCVNPDHLYPGDHSQNALDSVTANVHRNSRKTHCKNGHEFTNENTYFNSKLNTRTCLTCKKAYDYMRNNNKKLTLIKINETSNFV